MKDQGDAAIFFLKKDLPSISPSEGLKEEGKVRQVVPPLERIKP